MAIPVISYLCCLIHNSPFIQHILSLKADGVSFSNQLFRKSSLMELCSYGQRTMQPNKPPAGVKEMARLKGISHSGGKLTSQFCAVIDSMWLKRFSLSGDCHLDHWEPQAYNYSEATLLSEPGEGFLFFLSWVITGGASQGRRKERGK